jgi:hypothetical protein
VLGFEFLIPGWYIRGMSERKMVKIAAWPDPLVRERMEDLGFFFDRDVRAWMRFCDEEEVTSISEWLRRHQLGHEVETARGRGEVKRLPRLSDILVLRNGGSPTRCALCGAAGVPCRQWIEGDDTDSVDYEGAARFYLCGKCVQDRMQPHPRLYAPTEEQL